MAKEISNHKGFKIIEMSSSEAIEVFGGVGICDSCNGNHQKDYKGYYIAVLNRFYCQQCYDEWIERAKKYAEDEGVELNNFETTKDRLGI